MSTLRVASSLKSMAQKVPIPLALLRRWGYFALSKRITGDCCTRAQNFAILTLMTAIIQWKQSISVKWVYSCLYSCVGDEDQSNVLTPSHLEVIETLQHDLARPLHLFQKVLSPDHLNHLSQEYVLGVVSKPCVEDPERLRRSIPWRTSSFGAIKWTPCTQMYFTQPQNELFEKVYSLPK